MGGVDFFYFYAPLLHYSYANPYLVFHRLGKKWFFTSINFLNYFTILLLQSTSSRGSIAVGWFFKKTFEYFYLLT